jgi:hypothetical protein
MANITSKREYPDLCVVTMFFRYRFVQADESQSKSPVSALKPCWQELNRIEQLRICNGILLAGSEPN